MTILSELHGAAWTGVGGSFVGLLTGDRIATAAGIAIAVASALTAGALANYSRIRDERRRQEWLDFEQRLKMAAEAKAVEAHGVAGLIPDTLPARQTGGESP